MSTAGKVLVAVGLALLVAGAIFLLLARFGVTRLPGDVVARRGPVTIYAPVGLMILVSVILTVALNLFLRR